MRLLAGCLVALAAFATTAEAASIVVLQKGDKNDQILTVTREDGSPEASLTLICESPEPAFGVVVQSALMQNPKRIRAKADGASVPLGAAAGAAGAAIHLLKGPTGRATMARLTKAQVVELEWGSGPQRFRLADGAAEVARFREICGL